MARWLVVIFAASFLLSVRRSKTTLLVLVCIASTAPVHLRLLSGDWKATTTVQATTLSVRLNLKTLSSLCGTWGDHVRLGLTDCSGGRNGITKVIVAPIRQGRSFGSTGCPRTLPIPHGPRSGLGRYSCHHHNCVEQSIWLSTLSAKVVLCKVDAFGRQLVAARFDSRMASNHPHSRNSKLPHLPAS